MKTNFEGEREWTEIIDWEGGTPWPRLLVQLGPLSRLLPRLVMSWSKDGYKIPCKKKDGYKINFYSFMAAGAICSGHLSDILGLFCDRTTMIRMAT
jgi:hypothetical protein